MLVMMLFLLVAILTLSGLCIGISQIQLAQTETQIVADCCSISGTTIIGENHTGSLNTPEKMAMGIPVRNTIMGVTAAIQDEDVVLGSARMDSSGKMTFIANGTPENAVKVTVSLADNAAMKPQSLMFPFQMSLSKFGLEKTSISAKLEHDICVVLDRSGSMRSSKDPGGRYPYHPNRSRNYWYYYPHPTDSRWGAVVNAINPLIESLNGTPMNEQISVVTFGSSFRWSIWQWNATDTDVNPTTSYGNIVSTLSAIGEEKPMHGATEISSGMDRAREILKSSSSRDYAFKTMVVLTDGVWYGGYNPETAAQKAADEGITVHTITFASSGGFETMKKTAAAGNGKAYWAPDESALRDIFAEIGAAPPVALIE